LSLSSVFSNFISLVGCCQENSVPMVGQLVGVKASFEQCGSEQASPLRDQIPDGQLEQNGPNPAVSCENIVC
jgi:hypothetical protein